MLHSHTKRTPQVCAFFSLYFFLSIELAFYIAALIHMNMNSIERSRTRRNLYTLCTKINAIASDE